MKTQTPQKLSGVGVSEKIFNSDILAVNATDVKQLDNRIFSPSNISHSKLFSLQETFQAITTGKIANHTFFGILGVVK